MLCDSHSFKFLFFFTKISITKYAYYQLPYIKNTNTDIACYSTVIDGELDDRKLTQSIEQTKRGEERRVFKVKGRREAEERKRQKHKKGKDGNREERREEVWT